jgi:hypothetical protein
MTNVPHKLQYQGHDLGSEINHQIISQVKWTNKTIYIVNLFS